MVKVKVKTPAGEITYKVTQKYVQAVELNGEKCRSNILPTTVCKSCLERMVSEEKGTIKDNFPARGYLFAPPIVFRKKFYLWGPALKCGACGKRTATLLFEGFISLEGDEVKYLSKSSDFSPQVIGKIRRE